jgi:hypothetical protein
MNEKLIKSKIDELRIVLEQELPNTAVSFEITFTGTGTHQRIEHKQPEQLKRQSISMRNVKGEFISCFEDGFLEEKAMKEFHESGYGDKPWNYDFLKEKQNKDIAIEYAFYLVSESFIHLGGIMNKDELVYKGTKKWEEAKHITSFTIGKMTFNPFTNKLIDESGFFERVREEINNL